MMGGCRWQTVFEKLFPCGASFVCTYSNPNGDKRKHILSQPFQMVIWPLLKETLGLREVYKQNNYEIKTV